MTYSRIIVNHVPKTGGTTFLSALANGLAQVGFNKSHRVQIVDPCQDARTVIAGLPADHILVNGHYAFRDPSEKAPYEFWITTWRDPVSTFFSAWDYYRCARRRRLKLSAHDPLHREQILAIRQAQDFEHYLAEIESGQCVPFPKGWEPREGFDFVVRVDDLADDLARLGQLLDIPLEIPPRSLWNESRHTVDRERYAPLVRELLERYTWEGPLV